MCNDVQTQFFAVVLILALAAGVWVFQHSCPQPCKNEVRLPQI